MASRDDDFLGRWSRRKRESRDGLKRKGPAEETARATEEPATAATDEQPRQDVAALPAKEAPRAPIEAEPVTTLQDQLRAEQAEPTVAVNDTPAAKTDDAKPSEEDLGEFEDVDFDKLNYASDYQRFMDKDVPEAIRRRALRMLWTSNPVLANIDGLNDYDEDFTDAALAMKIIGSNYNPGTGYLTEEERVASYSDEAREHGERLAREQSGSDDDEEFDDDIDDAEGLDADGVDGEEDATAEVAEAQPPAEEDGPGEQPPEPHEKA